MKKSALQVARAAYQPKLPKSLKGTYISKREHRRNLLPIRKRLPPFSRIPTECQS